VFIPSESLFILNEVHHLNRIETEHVGGIRCCCHVVGSIYYGDPRLYRTEVSMVITLDFRTTLQSQELGAVLKRVEIKILLRPKNRLPPPTPPETKANGGLSTDSI
jgi:hypothetical protein